MGSKRGKQEQQQQNYWNQQTQQAVQQVQEKSPLEQRFEDETSKFLDFESGKSGPIDITKAPGLGASLDLYSRAKQRSAQQRLGRGALQLSDGGAGGYAEKLKQQEDMQREDDAAGALTDAYRIRSAEVHGSVLPLAQLDQGRRQARAELTSGNYRALLGTPKQKPFWQSLVEGVVTGAAGPIATKI